MEGLQVIEQKGQRVLTTQQLAESYGATEKKIRDNFSNNKNRYEEGKHYFKLEGKELREFKNETEKIGMVWGNASSLLLWTEKGALLHAKSLNTDEAWDVYGELVESYFRVQSLPPMSKELQAIFMIDTRTIEIDNRVTKLENTMTIDYGQQEELNELAKKIVVKFLGGKDTPAYKELNKKAFSQMWKDYKRVLGVNSYKNTAVKDFSFAKQVICDWKPSRELELMIKGCNAQLRM